MIDEQTIKRATEEVLEELDMSEQQFALEPALGAGDGAAARQIRLLDPEGSDRAAVVDFQDKDGKVSIYFEDIKAKIRQQLETLIEIGGE